MILAKSEIIFFSAILSLFTSFLLYGQTDTIKYKWPYDPMTSARTIGGTFAEYRSTSANGHYHNGTDMSGAAGTPILAVLPGVVAVAYDDGGTGYDSYIRVTSTINGQSKNITYYHTRPVVSVGQQVVEGQQISTVAIDHVHLIDYRFGGSLSTSHLNALRPGGGLTIYEDYWKPNIRYVKFFVDNSNIQLQPSSLGGKVDIIVHIEEVSSPPGGSAGSNNGAYQLGYKILSADSQQVVYAPPDNSLRYTYYNKPGDDYVNINYYQPESNTSKHVYIVTNGNGSSNVASTQVVTNNYWNVDNYPYGNYVVMVYAADSRGNADTVYIPVSTTDIDLVPPAAPTLKYVKKDSTNYFTIAWETPTDPDLKGFRLYYSIDGSSYNLRDNEAVLTSLINSKTYFYNQSNPLFLKLYAVDTAPTTNVSVQSDVYGIRMLNDNKKILIVDGFDRYSGSGSWAYPYHDFVVSHAKSFNLSFESCSNEQIINGTIDLNNYQLVIWILGDESTADQTFSAVERTKVAAYLENGGKLFVSGSEIAWELEGASSATTQQTQFLRTYLKAKYIADDSNIYGVYGVDSTEFAGLGFGYGIVSNGSPYLEDYPDIIDTVGGSIPILKYNSVSTAGIAFTGNFNNSANTGQLVYLAFPFETINLAAERTKVMSAALRYFNLIPPSDIIADEYIPMEFSLSQNYPNPFNPATKIQFTIPPSPLPFGKGTGVRLLVYDILGNKITTLVDEEKPAGSYEVEFNAEKLSSGVYFYRITAGDFMQTKKMLLLR